MVWDTVKGGFAQWQHHPTPLRNAVKELNVLACENTWQAHVKMYASQFGNWLYSTVVPSPFEVARKTLTGSYKCGFYFGTEFGSPVDIIWQDGSVSEMLMEIAHPAVQGLFYLWAAESAWEFLGTWQRIITAQEMCNVDRNECLLKDGAGSFFNTGGAGSPNFYTEVWDPNDWHSSFGGFISVPTTAYVTADVFGRLVGASAAADNVTIQLEGDTAPLPGASLFYPHIAVGDTISYHLHYEGTQLPTVISPVVYCTMSAGPLQHFDVYADRFTVHESPSRREHPCKAMPSRPLIVPPV